jgi:hypothetical protein
MQAELLFKALDIFYGGCNLPYFFNVNLLKFISFIFYVETHEDFIYFFDLKIKVGFEIIN